MASANTNKTIFTIGVIAVIGFLTWKLWPALSKAIKNFGSGGGGSAGGAVGGGYGNSGLGYDNPYNQNQSPLGSLNFGGGQGGGGLSGLGKVLTGEITPDQWAADIGQGDWNAQSPTFDQLIEEDNAAINASSPQSIGYEPYQNFDVNQLAYSPGSDQDDYTDELETTSAPELYIDDSGNSEDNSGDDSGDLGGNVGAGGY
jgi:hypothetical protein